MDDIAGICDAIIVILHMRTAINAFPDLLEQLFVSSDSCSPEDVLAILKFSENFEGDAEKSRVASYFRNSIRKLEESGESGYWEGFVIAFIGTNHECFIPPRVDVFSNTITDLKALLRCITTNATPSLWTSLQRLRKGSTSAHVAILSPYPPRLQMRRPSCWG